MTLETPWQIEQTWGSNQAVLKGVLSGLRPAKVVECGCGNFSTPLLRSSPYVQELISIEHDQRWFREVSRRWPSDLRHRYIPSPLPGINNGRDASQIQAEVLRGIRRFYRTVAREIGEADFLLVDTYRCARVPAALSLAPRSSVVMLHDVRPHSRDYYQYHRLDATFQGWRRYEHRPKGSINRVHLIPWTALYSKEELNLDLLQPAIREESQRLWDQSVGLEEIHGR